MSWTCKAGNCCLKPEGQRWIPWHERGIRAIKPFLAARRLAHIVRFVSRSLRNAIFRSIVCG